MRRIARPKRLRRGLTMILRHLGRAMPAVGAMPVAVAMSAAAATVLALIAPLLFGVTRAASAEPLTAAETEGMIRAVYYEGLPDEQLAEIGPAGCARLAEMLADPAEKESHAQILLGLGACGGPGSFEAIVDWAEAPRRGEIDRPTFRAWQALPFALAKLAEREPRALRRLVRQLDDQVAPEWTFRHHRGARLVNQSRRAAASCLAMTGLADAERALERAERSGTDEQFEAHLQDAMATARSRRAERAAQSSGAEANR